MECKKKFGGCFKQKCLHTRVCIDSVKAEAELLDKETFFKLIGAPSYHAAANTIWDTLEAHGYLIFKNK